MKFFLPLIIIPINIFCTSVRTEGIIISKTKSIYTLSDKVFFDLENATDTTYQYYVGVDGFYDDAWHPAVKDIDTSAPERAAIIKSMPAHTITKVQGGPLKYFMTPIDKSHNDSDRINTLKFRFVIFYRLQNNTKFNQQYSEEFIIKQDR